MYSQNSFAGTFDGCGHTISNLYYTNTNTMNYNLAGLFGYVKTLNTVACTPTIKNLNLTNVDVTASGGNAGGLVGGTAGSSTKGYVTLANCSVSGSVTALASVQRAGGLIGSAASYLTVENCSFVGIVDSTVASTSNVYFGGIAGYSDGYATFTDCYAAGTVSTVGSGSNVGGLLGYLGRVSGITGCFALQSSVDKEANSVSVGRLVGTAYTSETYRSLFPRLQAAMPIHA